MFARRICKQFALVKHALVLLLDSFLLSCSPLYVALSGRCDKIELIAAFAGILCEVPYSLTNIIRSSRYMCSYDIEKKFFEVPPTIGSVGNYSIFPT